MSRTELVAKAEQAEASERYDDMVSAMSELAKLGAALSVDERNLLSVAYKNVVGARRASWRVLEQIRKTAAEKHGSSSWQLDSIKTYQRKVETELETLCGELLSLVNKHLVVSDESTDGQVFYHKMAGDYNRYLAEITGSSGSYAADAAAAYERASKAADSGELPSTNPIRLGLALNYSVFQYEIMSRPKEACAIAKQAFDDAIGELDKLDQSEYKDSTLIMQLIRDNLTLWTSDAPEESSGPREDDGTALEEL